MLIEDCHIYCSYESYYTLLVVLVCFCDTVVIICKQVGGVFRAAWC